MGGQRADTIGIEDCVIVLFLLQAAFDPEEEYLGTQAPLIFPGNPRFLVPTSFALTHILWLHLQNGEG